MGLGMRGVGCGLEYISEGERIRGRSVGGRNERGGEAG